MKSKNLIPVQGVYSLDGWTQWNPLLSAENRPADISSVDEESTWREKKYLLQA